MRFFFLDHTKYKYKVAGHFIEAETYLIHINDILMIYLLEEVVQFLFKL